MVNRFKTKHAENIFYSKYAQGKQDTWDDLCIGLVDDVCGLYRGETSDKKRFYFMPISDRVELLKIFLDMKAIPAGRYLYYARRPLNFYSNCFATAPDSDTREAWGKLIKNVSDFAMCGGGVGVDYSCLREKGALLKRSGGTASGGLGLMYAVNEYGRMVRQGGARRTALLAALNWRHPDIYDFLYAKEISPELESIKARDFNFPIPFDMTNFTINFDDHFDFTASIRELPKLWFDAVLQMCKTGEPGLGFNFGIKRNEFLTNACSEFRSDTINDSCNLASVNMANIDTIEDFKTVCELTAKFLVYGGVRTDLPNTESTKARQENRRIGLGLMGIHEWLLKRNKKYEVDAELESWLKVYKEYSEIGANDASNDIGIMTPRAYRAIAPTGTIGILSSTTTGIEPLYSVAHKRRYLDGHTWKFEYVINPIAHRMIEEYGIDPDNIETASALAKDPERRIKFQADVQKYVDMGISSTINLPQWGTEFNNENTAKALAKTLVLYARELRGITCYPDGVRAGQPLSPVPYKYALSKQNQVFEENKFVCKGGVCGE